MDLDALEKLAGVLLWWAFVVLGWLGWVASAITFLQLRHGLPRADTKGSYISCKTYQGVYHCEVTIEPSYLAPSFFPFTLRLLGIGSIQTASVKQSLVRLDYYDEDGDPYEVPHKEWHFENGRVSVKRGFLASKRIQKLGITAPQGFTKEEIESKISCRVLADSPSGRSHMVGFEVANTNRIYKLRDYPLVLDAIPAGCLHAQFVRESRNRASKNDFQWVPGSHPVLIIPEIDPLETINVTCKYTA